MTGFNFAIPGRQVTTPHGRKTFAFRAAGGKRIFKF